MSPTQEGPTTSILSVVALTGTDRRPPRSRYALSGHGLQPLAVLAPFATYGVKVHALQFLGQRPSTATAYRTAIQRTDRYYLGRRAGEKCLVTNIDLVPGNSLFADGISQLLREGEDRVPGDPVKTGGQVRREDMVVSNDKYVFTAALRHIALVIQHQRLLGSAVQRFAQRQHRVDVVAVGFRLAHRYVDVVPGEGGSAHLDTAIPRLRVHVGWPGPRCNHNVRLEVVRTQAHTLGAIKAHGPQVAFLQLVLTHHVLLRLVERGLVKGDGHTEDVGRVKQPGSVLLETENTGTTWR